MKRSRSVLGIIVLLLAMGLAAARWSSGGEDQGNPSTHELRQQDFSPSVVVSEFFTSRDPQLLCSLMTAEYLEEAAANVVGDPVNDCPGAVMEGLERNPERTELPVEVLNTEEDGDVATVKAQVGSSLATITLRFVEGAWLVDHITIE